MLYCGCLDEHIVEYVAEECARSIYHNWPERMYNKNQLKVYVNPLSKDKVVWKSPDGDITMGEVAQSGAPLHERQTNPAYKAIEHLANHPFLDTSKTYDEMLDEFLKSEFYNNDKARGFQDTLQAKVNAAQNAVVAFRDATNQFEAFRHTSQDYHHLRHALGSLWQKFCYPAIASWINKTLIPRLTTELSAYRGAPDKDKPAEAVNACMAIEQLLDQELPEIAKAMLEGNEEAKVEDVAPDQQADDPKMERLMQDTAKEMGLDFSELEGANTAMSSVKKMATYQVQFHAGPGQREIQGIPRIEKRVSGAGEFCHAELSLPYYIGLKADTARGGAQPRVHCIRLDTFNISVIGNLSHAAIIWNQWNIWKQARFNQPQDFWHKNQNDHRIPPELRHCAALSTKDLKAANHKRAEANRKMRAQVHLRCLDLSQADRDAGAWEYVLENNTYHIIAWLTFDQAQKVAIRSGT